MLMTWEANTFWFSPEKYEIRQIRSDMWIVFSPDGYVDVDVSMDNVKNLADAHLKAHPILP